jgi:DNA-binding GntR family transcriptional regulator
VAQQSGRVPAKFRQIADDLRARIGAGEFPVGTQLPTKRELASGYGAAIGTVDSALRVLRELGVAETRQGAGAFVISQHPGESEAQQLSEQVAALRAQVATLRGQVAELAARVEAAEDASLREIVGRLQAGLADLYGKTGFTYPEDRAAQRRPDREARHG